MFVMWCSQDYQDILIDYSRNTIDYDIQNPCDTPILSKKVCITKAMPARSLPASPAVNGNR
jgi:hypothetical protein